MERTQPMARGARAVKAFNTVFATRQAGPKIDVVKLDGFGAADDSAAKPGVMEFANSLGFKPLDTAPLAMAWALEDMGALNISLNVNNGSAWQSGWKLLGPTGDGRNGAKE